MRGAIDARDPANLLLQKRSRLRRRERVTMVSSVQSIRRQATVATVKFCLVMLGMIFLAAGSVDRLMEGRNGY